MRLNLGLNLSKIARDLSKGKPSSNPLDYIWCSVSKSIEPGKKKK